jgi:hypothetical protein
MGMIIPITGIGELEEFRRRGGIQLSNRHSVLLRADIHIHCQMMDCYFRYLGFPRAWTQSYKAQGFELS